MTLLVSLISAYGLGCIATGYYLVLWRTGQDVRRIGTGTTGAMNAARLSGVSAFIGVCLGDFLKGVLALFIAQALQVDVYLCGIVLLVMKSKFCATADEL